MSRDVTRESDPPSRKATTAGRGRQGKRSVTRESERRRIEKSFDVFGLGARQRGLILEALDSSAWDWFRDCDGCTAVSEMHWPTKYFPPCVRHDFDWVRGLGDYTASKNFYDLQRAYGVPKWRAGLRMAAVTVAWYALKRCKSIPRLQARKRRKQLRQIGKRA